MPAEGSPRLRGTMATRLAARAGAAAVALAVLVAICAAAISWITEVSRVERAAQQVGETRLPALTEAAWSFSPGLHQQVEALLRLPDVAGATVELPGETIRVGVIDGASRWTRRWPIEHALGGRLGTLVVTFDVSSITARALRSALWLALLMTLPVAAMAALGWLLFRREVGRHLVDLAAYARTITVDTLGNTFRFRRSVRAEADELDHLADAMRTMRANLATEIGLRRDAESRLDIEEQRYRAVFDAVGEALFIHDAADGAILDVNPSAERLYRLPRERLVGSLGVAHLSSGEPPCDAENARRWLQRCRDLGPQLFEWQARRGDGTMFRAEVSLTSVRIGGHDRIVAAVRDIEARCQGEEQIRHLQRMEVVGKLAGGVAHDFNNMLGGILGAAELARLRLAADHPVHRQLDLIVTASDRAADLTRKLLTFARRNRRALIDLDLHAAVGSVCGLLERTLHPSIRIERTLAASRVTLHADAAELENAVLNLCLNARDAMPEGGRLSLRTADRELDEAACAALAPFQPRPGRYVLLEVEDDGCGMPAEILPRIFEPFFTTKEVGKGTGLGLAAVYGTVTALNGAITVRSAIGQGSTFSLLLPVLADGGSAPVATTAASPDALGGTVLVVDDDPVVRQQAAECLRHLGCTVLIAENGALAVAQLRSATTPVSAVLLDLAMPGLGGEACLRDLRAIQPDLPVVICSGYARNHEVDRMLADGAVAFLAKPYRLAELAATMRRAMGGAGL